MVLNIESYAKPLILLPDTSTQTIPFRKGKSYTSPCPISEESFRVLESGLFTLAPTAGFNFTGNPAYTIFNNSIFNKLRFIFWKPVLKCGYPIYIISPLFGLLWPGDRAGTYELDMDEVFLVWRELGLQHVIDEVFFQNECDGVLSYLPPLYDNTVKCDLSWTTKDISDFKNDTKVIKKIACRPVHKI